MIWQSPEWFLALLILPLLIAAQWWYFQNKRAPAMLFSRTSDLKSLAGTWRTYGIKGIMLAQIAAFVLIIVALARPQEQNVVVEREVEGIDIVLVIDISSSMLAEDLKPNRFIAVKNIASDFVGMRPSDRIGLVVFARESITLVPPTLDHRLLQRQLGQLDLGIVRDGTAIGMGLATALNRLRDSEAESRVVVLLTDGENNAGEIDPLTAADLAAAMGVRVHVIGASTEGTAPYPVDDPVFGRRYFNIRVDVDDELMTEMAERTGGLYFRARDNVELQQVYEDIDAMERTTIEEVIYTDEKDVYFRFLMPGVMLLLISMFLDRTLLRTD